MVMILVTIACTNVVAYKPAPMTHIVAKTATDVILIVGQQPFIIPAGHDLIWRRRSPIHKHIARQIRINKGVVQSPFDKCVQYDDVTQSLTLLNVSLDMTGLYDASIGISHSRNYVANYSITVQGKCLNSSSVIHTYLWYSLNHRFLLQPQCHL